jgi:DnaJ-class molecular chaperone
MRCSFGLNTLLFLLAIHSRVGHTLKTHYDTLGISKSSTSKVITKKYRELAKKFHPDKNKKDPNAQDKFIELSKAYEILSDDQSRREYDHDLRFGGGGQNSDIRNYHNSQRRQGASSS